MVQAGEECFGGKVMMDVDSIILTELAEQRGFRNGKTFLLNQIEAWCRALSDSSAFTPQQGVTRGQVENANKLLEYLKNEK